MPMFTVDTLNEDTFRELWARGEPLVVEGLQSRFTIEWSPQYFVDKYGAVGCNIVDCQTDVNKKTTVGAFFEMFGRYEGRKEIWKLKVRSWMWIFVGRV